MALKPKFKAGDKIMCFYSPLLYEAKCIKSKIEDDGVKYFIHYNGWNKNWDEWVPESRVMEINEANMQKQKELEATYGKRKKKSKIVKESSNRNSTDRALPPQEKSRKAKGKKAAAAPSSPSLSLSLSPSHSLSSSYSLSPTISLSPTLFPLLSSLLSPSLSSTESLAEPQGRKRRPRAEQNVKKGRKKAKILKESSTDRALPPQENDQKLKEKEGRWVVRLQPLQQ